MSKSPLSAPRTPAAAFALLACTVGCLPYTVGSTARTVEPGEVVRSASYYMIPNAVELLGDSVAAPIYGIDSEMRLGLDERSDVGIRLPSLSGVVVTYKRRLGELPAKDEAPGPGVALVGGAGFVNWGEHAHLEATMIASGRESDRATLYGGLRVMQVIPIAKGAPHDSPTAGGFLGLRLGEHDRGITPEIAIYYDRSTLGIRDADFIVVPSVSVHGDVLRGFRDRSRGASSRGRPRIPISPGWPRRATPGGD